MDFFSGLAKAAQSATASSDHTDKPSSGSDLFSSAKLVAEAAQSQFSNQSENIDKPKVAGATADLIDAASQYGKLDETQGFGKYVGQAEGYLRKYGSSGAPVTDPAKEVTPPADTAIPAGSEQEKPAPTTTIAADTTPAPESTQEKPEPTQHIPDTATDSSAAENPSAPAADDTGDYKKLAEGFLKSASIE